MTFVSSLTILFQCGWWDPDSGTDDASDTFNDYINYEDNANLMGALPPRRVHAGPTCLSEPGLCVVLFDMEAECVVPSLDKPRDKRIPLISPATFLEWIPNCSPNEYNDLSQQQPAVVAQLTARIEQLASVRAQMYLYGQSNYSDCMYRLPAVATVGRSLLGVSTVGDPA